MYRLIPLFFLLAGCPKKTIEPVLSSPQDLTLDVLNHWVEEICVLIEEEAGAQYTTTPHVREATQAELMQVVVNESVAIESAQHPEVPERVFRDEYQGQSVGGILGKYGIFTGVMYVDVDSIWAMAVQEHGGPEAVPAVAKVLLAHELVHALQAQAGASDGIWMKLADTDAFEAYRSVTEGQASWVERRVATRLGYDEVAQSMIEMQGWTFEDGPEHPGSFSLWSAYGMGDVFMQALHDEGGTALQWQAVSQPPPRSAMIFAPATYDPVPQPAPTALIEQYKGLERKLGQGSWRSLEGRVGEVQLRQMLFGYGEDAIPHIRAVQDGWRRESRLPDRLVALSTLWFEDDESARAFVDFLADRESDDNSLFEALEIGDGGVKITLGEGIGKGVSFAGNEERVYLFRRGSSVGLLHAQGFRPGLRADEVLGAMLARMEAE